jgi:hypothetical protein
MTCDPVIVRQGQAKPPEGAEVRPRGCDLAPCSAAALLWLDAIAEPSPQFVEAARESAERAHRPFCASQMLVVGPDQERVELCFPYETV